MISCAFENGNKASLRHAVVDCLVIKDNKILLVKRAENLVEGGKWGIIGGFVEKDETLKKAVSREIFEETGYKAFDINFLMIVDNPKRRNEERQNIAFVFVCKVGEKEGSPDNESTKQEWFDLNNLPREEEIAFDHYESIQTYLKHKDFPKPLFKSE